VDAGGVVQSAASYEPFGALLTGGASSYGFAGEWQDPTGLVYLRARFYSPELGIFLSRDPFPGFLTQPASLSPYLYAYNNPVLLTDPSGKNPLFLAGLLGSALSGFGFNEGMCPLEALKTLLNTYFDPPPPSKMTEVEKIGMGLTVALTIIAVVLPIEIVLILLTFEVSAACASGAVPACLLDVPLVAADIVVADFGVSLSMHAYESISSGYKKDEFEWIIIPSISDIFNE
jgi:RHS repeat-associated protein